MDEERIAARSRELAPQVWQRLRQALRKKLERYQESIGNSKTYFLHQAAERRRILDFQGKF
jgi:hypothetical protein